MPKSPIQTPGEPPIQSPEPTNPPIPVEIVSEEEMALIESSFAAASSPLFSPIRISKRLSFSPSSSTQFQGKARSMESITKRRLFQGEKVKDIEDLGDLGNTREKKIKIDSLLHRFRSKRGLSVTDIVAAEWCQKQMEFVLVQCKPKAVVAMNAGTNCHAKLEEEEVVPHDVIDIDKDDDPAAVVIIGEKVTTSNKGKGKLIGHSKNWDNELKVVPHDVIDIEKNDDHAADVIIGEKVGTCNKGKGRLIGHNKNWDNEVVAHDVIDIDKDDDHVADVIIGEKVGTCNKVKGKLIRHSKNWDNEEWCQKQMEFVLVQGKPKATEAMKAGTDRHVKLEEEVVHKVVVQVKEIEDSWALKLMNFIVGANQLLFEGLTRELPLIGFVEGVWMVGVIDEIRLLTTESVQSPFLVDYKTRSQATLPSEAQKRNGKLQLMCYKYMWDNIVTNNFPATRFYNFFGLNPHYILSEEVQDLAAASGFPSKTLDDLVMYHRNTCATLSPAHDELLLRYEYQGDHSLLGEEKFTYDSDWLMSQFKCSLEFWMGEREPSYVPQEERWKCRFCKFAPSCPNTSTESTTTIVADTEQ